MEKLGDDATIFVKNENKLNQMLHGNQILKSLALLAKVELVDGNITEAGSIVNPRSMGDDRWMYEDGVRLPAAEDMRRSRMPDTGDENTVFAETDDDYAQYSISETDDGRAVAMVDSNILSHIDTTEWDKTKKDQAKKAAKTALLAFKDGVQVNGITYKVNKVSRDEFTRSNDTERLYRKEPEIFVDKLRASANADDIITATTSWVNDGKLTHPRTDNFVDFAHGKVLIQAGVNQYEAETVVGITDAGEYVFYDVVDMEPISFKVKEEPSTAAAGKNAESAIQESSSENSITENGLPVKEQFSATDSGPTDNPKSVCNDRWMYEDGELEITSAQDMTAWTLTRQHGIMNWQTKEA